MVFLILPLGQYWNWKRQFGSAIYLYITHGGYTEISSHVESLRGISKSEISSFRPIWSFIHLFGKKTGLWLFQLFGLFLSNCELIHSSVYHNPVFGHLKPYFLVNGVGLVSECSDSDLQMSSKPHKPHQPENWSDHSCLWVWSLPEWEDCAIIISLPMPWVCLLCQHVFQCASIPEVCQHARGSSQKCLSFPEIPEGPRCPEGQDIVPLCQMAQNPQDCTDGLIFTWNDDICIV